MAGNYDYEFKNIYNRLEKYVREKYNNDGKLSEDVLDNAEFKKDDYFWRNYRNLRNIIIHNDGVTHITKEGLEVFRKKVENIVNPVKASKICIKDVYSVNADTKLNDVLINMKKKAYSNVPVLNNDNVVSGIFNYYTLFIFFNNHLDEIILETNKTTIGELKKYYSLDSNEDVQFKFISKNDNLNQINNIYYEIIDSGKQMGALLVTENGKPKEKLLGIITAEDIIKANI